MCVCVRVQNVSLKTALLDYIKRCLPGDSEKHNMVALCFSMCREIGENHEAAARTQLKIIESQPWGERNFIIIFLLFCLCLFNFLSFMSHVLWRVAITGDLKNTLVKVLTLLKDAAESYSKVFLYIKL